MVDSIANQVDAMDEQCEDFFLRRVHKVDLVFPTIKGELLTQISF